MDTLENYRQIIKNILAPYTKFPMLMENLFVSQFLMK